MRTLTAKAALIAVMVPRAFIAAQSTPLLSDPKAQFEVSSIKPYDPSTGIMLMRMLPGRFEATGVTVRQLLRQALGAEEYQVAGGPGWMNTERFVPGGRTETRC